MLKQFFIVAAFAVSFGAAAQTLPPPAPFGYQAPPAPASIAPGEPYGKQPVQQPPAGSAGKATPGTQPQTPAEKFAIVKVKTSQTANGILSTAADISEIKNEPRLKAYDLSKVAMEGRAVSTQTSGGSQLGISWTSVARTDTKDRREHLPKPWQSRVGSKDGTLPAGTAVTARGDMEELVTAIGKLFAAKEKEDPIKEDQRKQAQNNQGNAGLGAPVSQAQRSNDMGQLQPMPQVVTKTEEKPDTLGLTTEGCPIRVDEAAGVAIQQNQVTKNGAQQGNCADGDKQFPIVKSYSLCQDLVDTTAKKANPQFRRYYLDADGTTRYIDAECKTETETVFNITEDPAVCGFQVNATTLEVRKLVKLYYNNKNANRVELPSGCLPSEKIAAMTATKDVGLCAVRHDMTGKSTFEQFKIKFTYEGKEETYGPCTDTGKSWAHYNDYSNCPPVIDYEKNKVWKTSRTAYNKDGTIEYVTSSCGISQTDSSDLQLSAAGCENIIVDNYTGNVSYGTKRYFYDFGTGPKFVSDCNMDTTVQYPHQLRTVDWQNNDPLRVAKARTEVFIVVAGAEQVRSPATVRDGTPETPYQFVNNTVGPDPTQQPTYNGCDKVVTTASVDNYRRPDQTMYPHKVGPGPSQPPVNVCQQQQVDSRFYTTGYSYGQGVCMLGCPMNEGEFWAQVYYTKTTYQNTVFKYQKKNMDNGQIVQTFCEFASGAWNSGPSQFQNWVAWAGTNFGDYSSAPQQPPTKQEVLVSPCPF